MQKRTCIGGIIILLLVLIGMQFTTAVHANPTTPQRVTLSHTMILSETSIDGPAFFSTTHTFEGTTTILTALAWTGTDPLHHLNIAQFEGF